MEAAQIEYYIGLGANIGNPIKNIKQAIHLFEETIGEVVAISSFYTSEPYQMQSANKFVNACMLVKSTYQPLELLQATQKIEKELGRKEKSRDKDYQDRLIDIDLLFTAQHQINTPFLQLPHQNWTNRLFVLYPLRDIVQNITICGKIYNIEELINNMPAQNQPINIFKQF